MDKAGYADMEALRGEALHLLTLPADIAEARRSKLCRRATGPRNRTPICASAANSAQDVCWYNAISMQDGLAVKSDACVGCGYCFQVCPTGALAVPAGDILASAFRRSLNFARDP